MHQIFAVIIDEYVICDDKAAQRNARHTITTTPHHYRTFLRTYIEHELIHASPPERKSTITDKNDD